MFIAQRQVAVSKQLKNPDSPWKGQGGARIRLEHTIVKNPNWPEANQLTIYKRGQGFELGFTVKQIQEVVRVGLEPRTAELLHEPISLTFDHDASIGQISNRGKERWFPTFFCSISIAASITSASESANAWRSSISDFNGFSSE